jgi:geranylgeranyl diphosphate synthase type I
MFNHERYRVPITEGIDKVLQRQDPRLRIMMGYVLGFNSPEGDRINEPKLPGKLLRPTLFLMTYEGLGENIKNGMPVALALELVHNFSLVHDDIEDKDLERHGSPTMHALWGEAMAINAGDVMENMATEALLELSENCSPLDVIETMKYITKIRRRLLEGQDQDMRFEGNTFITTEDYNAMALGKTGAMIEAPIVLAARLAGKTGKELTDFMALGHFLGIAFQMQDDLLGIWGDTKKTGKADKPSDLVNRKITYVAAWALEKALRPETPESQEKMAILEFYGSKGAISEEEAVEMRDILDKFGARVATKNRVEEYCHLALTLINSMNIPDPLKEDYKAITQLFAIRDH